MDRVVDRQKARAAFGGAEGAAYVIYTRFISDIDSQGSRLKCARNQKVHRKNARPTILSATLSAHLSTNLSTFLPTCERRLRRNDAPRRVQSVDDTSAPIHCEPPPTLSPLEQPTLGWLRPLPHCFPE